MFNSPGRACKPSTWWIELLDGVSGLQRNTPANDLTHATPVSPCRSFMKIHPVGFLLKCNWLIKKNPNLSMFLHVFDILQAPLVLQHGKPFLPHSFPLTCKRERSIHPLWKRKPKLLPTYLFWDLRRLVSVEEGFPVWSAHCCTW